MTRLERFSCWTGEIKVAWMRPPPGTMGKLLGGTFPPRMRCSGTRPLPELLLGEVGDIEGVLEFDEETQPRPDPGRLDLSGNDAIDYSEPLGQEEAVGLLACMQRRGCHAVTVPVKRPDWLQVFIRGLGDEDFRAGNGTASVAFGWYLDATQALVEESVRQSKSPVVMVGHSAGGWLARALMQREGKDWVREHVRGLVTLGSPHFPPPPDISDMTRGCLRNVHEQHPGAFYSELIFYVTVAGDAVQGEQVVGNLPILELIQSPSQESTAFNSYRVVCGVGNTTGDGVVPLISAHLPGARQVTIKDCLHSINKAGTTQPTDKAYMCEGRIDDWLDAVAHELRSRPLPEAGD